MKVVITDAAYASLQQISDFIYEHNPVRAISFINEIIDCCLALADTHKIYPLVPRYEQVGIRRCVYRDYLIFYRTAKDYVEIINILHGSRNYDDLLW